MRKAAILSTLLALAMSFCLAGCGVVIEDFPAASANPPDLLNGEWEVASSMGYGTVGLHNDDGLVRVHMRKQDGETVETVGRFYVLDNAQYLVVKDAAGPRARLALLSVASIDAATIRLVSLNTQHISHIMENARRKIATEDRGLLNQIVLSRDDLEFLLNSHASAVFEGGEAVTLTRITPAAGA